MVACTANAYDEAADACLACGMDDYLAKPVSLERLKEVLKLWFPGHEPAGAYTRSPIDINRLRQLSDGDIAVECQLLEQLRISNDGDAKALREAMAAKDMARVAHSAHRMAGANMMIGASAFACACRTIAHAGRNENAAMVAAVLSLFDAEQARLNACLVHAKTALQTALPQAAATLPQAASLSFLVVDDHAFQRHTLRVLLSQLGASRIAEAVDGQAALKLIAESEARFDIIISDLDLTDMDGMELVRHLGRHHHASLILSSLQERSPLASFATLAEDCGIRLLGVMEKPLRRDLLATLIAKHFDEPAASETKAAGEHVLSPVGAHSQKHRQQ